jgi:hypothetical protein
VAFATLLVGCATISTNFDYDTDFDFTALQSYEWKIWQPDPDEDPLSRRRVERALVEGLNAEGYRHDPDDPDFYVAIHLGSEERIDVVNWGYGYGRGAGRYGPRDVSVYTYQEGTLIIDMVDARSDELVWRGTARRVFTSAPTAEEKTRIVNQAVQKLLAGFPPS